MSKRRRGYPSETNVKRGERVVHGDKELIERLGRADRCPCGSGRSFQTMLPEGRPISMDLVATTTCATDLGSIGRRRAVTLELSICMQRPEAIRHTPRTSL